MIHFFKNIAIIIISFLLMLGLTVLLDLSWFQQKSVRELLIYYLIALVMLITFRIIYLLNKS